MCACDSPPTSPPSRRRRGGRVRLALAGLALVSLPAAALGQAAAPEPVRIAVLKGLDKVTARITTIEAPIDETVRFGTLRIVVRTCRKRPPEEPPETTAFLEIEEVRPGRLPTRLFSGWMFASSPALSALEHPVYDVWVTDCRISRPDSESGSE